VPSVFEPDYCQVQVSAAAQVDLAYGLFALTPVAARSKAWGCGHSRAGIAG